MPKDYVVIGGGIIGTSIAREIRKRNLGEVIVLEKELGLGFHASGRNSGVIHSGINQKPGSKKAELCIQGSRMLRRYCKNHDVPIEECGTLVIAQAKKEFSRLEELRIQGLEAGVDNLRIIGREELREREPKIIGLQALLSPNGAIVDSKILLETLAKEASDLGAEYIYGAEVEKIEKQTIHTTNDLKIEAKHIINCAGLQADKIAHMVGVGLPYSIIPFRGDYLSIPAKINSMVYHIPDQRFPFLGVHLTKTIDGKVIAGPTATLSLGGREDYNSEGRFSGLSEMIREDNFLSWASKTLANPAALKQIFYNLRVSYSKNAFVKEVRKTYEEDFSLEDVGHYKSGIRAQLVNNEGNMVMDFLVESGENSTHILNAVSPGMTSSLAFAKHIVNNCLRKK